MKTFPITKQIFIATAISLALVLYFIFYALLGDKGVVKYFQLKKELQNKELIKEGLENKMENKQNMVNSMSGESLDLDLLDEEARKDLGYAGKQEIVIYDEDHKVKKDSN
ncbi:MAG: septum formation initiator family protein [Pseudomonadota bacterium]